MFASPTTPSEKRKAPVVATRKTSISRWEETQARWREDYPYCGSGGTKEDQYELEDLPFLSCLLLRIYGGGSQLKAQHLWCFQIFIGPDFS